MGLGIKRDTSLLSLKGWGLCSHLAGLSVGICSHGQRPGCLKASVWNFSSVHLFLFIVSRWQHLQGVKVFYCCVSTAHEFSHFRWPQLPHSSAGHWAWLGFPHTGCEAKMMVSRDKAPGQMTRKLTCGEEKTVLFVCLRPRSHPSQALVSDEVLGMSNFFLEHKEALLFKPDSFISLYRMIF